MRVGVMRGGGGGGGWGGGGSNEAVIDLLADEVDAECNDSNADAGSGVVELIGKHRVLPPLIPPPEELPCRPQRLLTPTYFFLD
ncbi:hypothetical protein FF1_000575 [Malus domestica]